MMARPRKVEAHIVITPAQGTLLPLPVPELGRCQMAPGCGRPADGYVDTWPRAALEAVPVDSCQACADRYGLPLQLPLL